MKISPMDFLSQMQSPAQVGASIYGGNMQRRDYAHTKIEDRAQAEHMFNISSAFNAKEAQKSRDWQTEMSNTEHQRMVGDLQKAGLNPLIALSGGNTPGGAQASASGSPASGGSAPNIGEGVAASAASAVKNSIALKKMKKELNIMEAQEKNITADTGKKVREKNILERKETQENIYNKLLKFVTEPFGTAIDQQKSSRKLKSQPTPKHKQRKVPIGHKNY